MKIFDISRTLRAGMAVWPGDPEFRSKPVLQVANGGAANLLEIRMGTHTGTHLDAPLHLRDSGIDAAAIPVETCFGPARVMQIAAERCITAADLDHLDWRGVERVLFKTASSLTPEDSFDPGFVYIAEDASEFLVEKRILLVGTDAPSVDPYESAGLRTHNRLVSSGIMILEGIRLGSVPPGDYNLVCLPLKIAGADGSPVRAILWR